MSVIEQNEFGSVELSAKQDAQIINIAHQVCQASVSLYGGHVLSWQPQGQQPVFWLSDTASFAKGNAIRGGIPLCWPWFGPYNKENPQGAGNHGFVRNQNWQLEQVTITADGVAVELSWQGKQMHPVWPYQVKLTQQLLFGQQFSQKLLITNLTEQAIEHSGALHSYFKVSNPENVTVPLLDNVAFDCKITGNKQVKQSRDNIKGPIDAIYYTDNNMEIIDTGLGRKIAITSENCHQWVLWNPGKETADAMADVHPNGEQEYICLEAANTEWQSIAAGQTAEIEQKISLFPV